MEPPLCLMSRRRPERVLRLPDDGDPRSERQGHALQAAGRAWQPAWLRERTTARGALELRVGGVGPERGLATSLGKIDGGRHERELRPAGNHHARCARQEKQARAACHPWQAAGAVGGARRRAGCRRHRHKRRGRMVPPRPSAAGWQPERNLRLPDEVDPLSGRRGHAVQAAGRARQPAWRRERIGGGASVCPLRLRCHDRRGRLTSLWRVTANGQPERVLRLTEGGAPRSDRQGHAIQAAARVW